MSNKDWKIGDVLDVPRLPPVEADQEIDRAVEETRRGPWIELPCSGEDD